MSEVPVLTSPTTLPRILWDALQEVRYQANVLRCAIDPAINKALLEKGNEAELILTRDLRQATRRLDSAYAAAGINSWQILPQEVKISHQGAESRKELARELDIYVRCFFHHAVERGLMKEHRQPQGSTFTYGGASLARPYNNAVSALINYNNVISELVMRRELDRLTINGSDHRNGGPLTRLKLVP